jgi:hypothetical protein
MPTSLQRNSDLCSEEKLAYCMRTFDEFEGLGLAQEYRSPKYKGMRDLTDVSVYLAQVR